MESDAYLFADVTKIVRIIRDDWQDLQRDLNKMEDCCNNWLHKFHLEKCKFINIHRHGAKQGNNVNCTLLWKTKEEKDIGVTIDQEITFEKDIRDKVNKPNAAIRKPFKSMSADLLIPLYKTLS